MPNKLAIRVNNVTKCYHVYETPLHRFKQIFWDTSKKYYNEFWALRHVSFELRSGESLGIIGRNGSGKSTLLQIIAGILKPTEGEVEVNGRIAALLELGSGFNQDFTGRENVYLNGSILGMSTEEIDNKFDDIASFADIGDFIDQPVKTYSTGMLLRLAFAVQVQIEPDILIVDEALAVGDALFQKRCFQKMERLISMGTVLLFVSHEQESIRTLTSRALLLHHGMTRAYGASSEVILDYRRLLHEEEKDYYQHLAQELENKVRKDLSAASGRSERMSFGDRDAEIVSVRVLNSEQNPTNVFYPLEKIIIEVYCKIYRGLNHLNIALRIRNKEGVKIYSWGTLNQDMAIYAGLQSGEIFWEKQFGEGEEIKVTFSCLCAMGENLYEVQASVSEEGKPYYIEQRMLHWQDEAAFFQVVMNQREYFFGGTTDLRMKAHY